MKELEEEWSKLPGSPPAPARLLRSAQQAAASAVPEVSGGVDEDESEEGGAVGGAVVMENIDPYDLADPVDLLAKMAKDFYEKVVCLCNEFIHVHSRTIYIYMYLYNNYYGSIL